MSRKKQIRIIQTADFHNVFNKDRLPLLPKNTSIILELGCGKGAYTLALAKIYPNQHFVGIDLKADRIWCGAKTALENKITNVSFLKTRIEQIDTFFPSKSISEIWITFPDPFPRKKHTKKRLVSLIFLEIYKKILKPDGIIHLKTDDYNLFHYAIENFEKEKIRILQIMENIYATEINNLDLLIQTDFEKKHLEKGRKIYYLKGVI